ncbi:MAG: hypothetical protein RDV48_13145 [Candidatus Eremiobacteraeota bacterium]|nr:hypothetical protein [Candidatus Eremiobacteraeota bacterium]
MAISKRDFDLLRDRVSQLESKLYALDNRLKVQEKKLDPKELHRIIKTEEKAQAIESQMGATERPL